MNKNKKIKEFSTRSLCWENCNIRIDLHKTIFFYLRQLIVHLGHPRFGSQNSGVVFLQISFSEEMKVEVTKCVDFLILNKIFEKVDVGENGLMRFDFSFKRTKKRISPSTAIRKIKTLLKTFSIDVKEIDCRCFKIEETTYVIDGENVMPLKEYLEKKYVLHEIMGGKYYEYVQKR